MNMPIFCTVFMSVLATGLTGMATVCIMFVIRLATVFAAGLAGMATVCIVFVIGLATMLAAAFTAAVFPTSNFRMRGPPVKIHARCL